MTGCSPDRATKNALQTAKPSAGLRANGFALLPSTLSQAGGTLQRKKMLSPDGETISASGAALRRREQRQSRGVKHGAAQTLESVG